MLFIDEIHRLPRAVEELLYPAMEDFAVNFVIDKGLHARDACVCRCGRSRWSAPPRGRACCPRRCASASASSTTSTSTREAELTRIVARSARILGVPRRAGAARARSRGASRGTPRIANRLLRRVRDYAQVKGDGADRRGRRARRARPGGGGRARASTGSTAGSSRAIIEQSTAAGRSGIEAMAATINDDAETLAELVEPYLLKIGFLAREPDAAVARPPAAYAHLGKPAPTRPAGGQAGLFE